MIQNILPRLTYFFKDFSAYIIIILVCTILTLVLSYKIFNSHISQKLKKIIIVFLFALYSTVIVYIVCEAYFRYSYDVPDGLGFLRVNKKWQERHVNYVFYNKVQFRDIDFDIKKKNESAVKIGVLGDSITFGGGIENPKDRFTDLLKELLAKQGYNVEVYNLGKPGHDTEAEINVYKRVEDLNFDILIWQYFLNDIQAVDKSTGTPIIEKTLDEAKTVKFFSDRSYFFDYLYWRISTKHNKTIKELKNADFENYRDSQKLARHKQEIVDFAKVLKDSNKKVIVIIFPSVFFIGSNYPANDIHETMDSLFKAQDFEVIDLLDYLKDKDSKDLVASRLDAHPNEYVHNLAAEKLSEVVRPLLSK